MQIKVDKPSKLLMSKLLYIIDESYIGRVTLNSEIKHISIDTVDLNFNNIGLLVSIINSNGHTSTIV